MAGNLTKTAVERLEAPESGYRIVWDHDLKGFGLRVTSNGVKSWLLQARIKGRSRRITIGRYPGVSPTVAATKAKKLIGHIANDGDPVADKSRAKVAGVTLEAAFTEYTQTRRRKKDGKALKPRTKSDMIAVLDESFAEWKKRPIASITRDMVRTRYQQRVAVSPVRANLAFRYLRAVLNFSIASYRDSEGRPVLTDNPVRVLSEASHWHGVEARTTVLSPDDLKAWVPAVLALAETPDRPVGTGKENPRLRHGEVFRDLLLFMALTGCRRGEAMKLRPQDVDLEANTITFPDTKNRRDHQLPLTPYLHSLLKGRIDVSRGALVFSSPFDGAPTENLRYALTRVRAATGLDFAPHDLRRLTASSLERLAVPVYTIKAVLNHLPGASDVTGGYVQVDNAMKLDALTKLDRFLFGYADRGRKVVSFRPVK